MQLEIRVQVHIAAPCQSFTLLASLPSYSLHISLLPVPLRLAIHCRC